MSMSSLNLGEKLVVTIFFFKIFLFLGLKFVQTVKKAKFEFRELEEKNEFKYDNLKEQIEKKQEIEGNSFVFSNNITRSIKYGELLKRIDSFKVWGKFSFLSFSKF